MKKILDARSASSNYAFFSLLEPDAEILFEDFLRILYLAGMSDAYVIGKVEKWLPLYQLVEINKEDRPLLLQGMKDALDWHKIHPDWYPSFRKYLFSHYWPDGSVKIEEGNVVSLKISSRSSVAK